MVPNKGTTVPGISHRDSTNERYAAMISVALKTDLGTGSDAAKTIMRWTGASDRAAKYWLAGTRGPGGRHLVLLAKNSDEVLHLFLRMANRELFKLSVELNAARASLARAMELIDQLK
jgi:hypothetical protein